jgi:hypothetical protein
MKRKMQPLRQQRSAFQAMYFAHRFDGLHDTFGVIVHREYRKKTANSW